MNWLGSEIQIQLLTAVVAVACALPGVFLVLRRLALLSDALSHAILFGIVVAYWFTHNLSSPWLVLGAALTGVLTVSFVELLNRTGLVKEDAAIGLVFPLLFSLGVILVSQLFRNEHLDTDAVLAGDPNLAVRARLEIGGVDWGAQGLWVMLAILLLNVVYIAAFWKELKLATFDPALATALGFSPALLHYGLTTLVSLTAVGAFDAVGSILVVALMIGPAAAAYLLTDRLWLLLVLSAVLAVICALAGYWVARWLGDVSISGAMATMVGVVFALVFVAAPERGLIALGLLRLRQRWEFAQAMLAIHLAHHEGKPEAEEESKVAHLHEHLRWQPVFVAQVVRRAERQGLVECRQGQLELTPAGRQLAQEALMNR